MAKAYLEGSGWAIRARYKGNDIYVSGSKSRSAAESAACKRKLAIDKQGAPKGRGPQRTTAAQAMQDYALARLPFKKGAAQEAVRFNQYLRAAGLDTLAVVKLSAQARMGCGKYFEVTLKVHTHERTIAQSLVAHRKAQMTKTADAHKHRAVLAATAMADITRGMMQDYVDAARREGAKPATLQREQALWRGLFNYAFSTWAWTSLQDNPATMLKMPQVDNERKRVVSEGERELLDAAIADCRNHLVRPVVTLLSETARRASEPLEKACWRDVDWQRCLLRLNDPKEGGEREVPLSPLALQALRDIGPGDADERIVCISYEAMRGAWNRICKRAGIEDLNLHDLRRTAATKMALKTGNLFLVQALTGHKTLKMVERYVQVNAGDVVNVMHATGLPDPRQGAIQSLDVSPGRQQVSITVGDTKQATGGDGGVTLPAVMLSMEQAQVMAQMAAQMAVQAYQQGSVNAAQAAGAHHARQLDMAAMPQASTRPSGLALVRAG